MDQPSASTRTDGILRIAIIGLGVIVFFLLFLADKTNLSTTPRTDIGETSSGATTLLAALPKLNDESALALQLAVDSADDSAAVSLLDSLIQRLEGTGQYAHAAVYAARLSILDSTATRAYHAGQLARRATQLTNIQADSLLYRQVSDLAMRELEQANKLAPQQENTLLGLGLSYIESNVPANFMKGVLTIRQVLSVNPDNLEANFRLGVFSIQSGQLEKAVQRFEKVLSIQPDDQEARFQLARAQFQLGQIDQAKANLQQVLKQTENPNLKAAAESALQQMGAGA